jgi:hypothetical protein
MKKISLDLQSLSVVSFQTAPADEAQGGTVHGHWSQVGTCDARVGTCQAGGTCAAGCGSKGCTGTICI